jgi:hypothetical protein
MSLTHADFLMADCISERGVETCIVSDKARNSDYRPFMLRYAPQSNNNHDPDSFLNLFTDLDKNTARSKTKIEPVLY